MNALLFAHVGIRAALLGRAVSMGRSRLLSVVLGLAALEAVVRLFVGAGEAQLWTLASAWSPAALTDLLLTVTVFAAQRRTPALRQAAQQHADALRATRQAGERAAAHRIAAHMSTLVDEHRMGGSSTLLRDLRTLAPDQPAPVESGDRPTDIALARVGRELRMAAPPGVSVRLDLAEDLGPLRVDATPLRDALHRLGHNAVQAMPAGGELRLRASVSKLTARNVLGLSAGHWLRVELSDTGTGMSRETLARCQEPFFSTQGDLAGLGLCAVRAFAERAGGCIEVKSQRNQGTTVTLWLPAATPSERRQPATTAIAALTTTP